MARQDNTLLWLALGGIGLYVLMQQQQRRIMPAPGTPIPVGRPDEFGQGVTPSGTRVPPAPSPTGAPPVIDEWANYPGIPGSAESGVTVPLPGRGITLPSTAPSQTIPEIQTALATGYTVFG